MGDVASGSKAAARGGPVEVVEEADAAGVARISAERLSRTLGDALAARGEATLALSGGNTPRATYALLARAGVDWSRVRVFWVDERAVVPSHERSNYGAAKSILLDPAHVPDDRVHRMHAEQTDGASAASDYEALLRRHVALGPSGFPTFDAMVLGMGDDGHTASLFPGEPTVTVTDRWVATVPANALREARMTLTTPVIQAALDVFVLLVGPDKHAPLLRAWAPEGDARQTPIRIVRGCHGATTWITDRAAARSARPE
jgi:6-phosphogluconolactonase